MSHWRDKSRKIINKILSETKGQDEKAIRKALRDAYPFGERAMHSYKIWLDEIQVQMGKRRFGQSKESHDHNQQNLF